MPSIALNFQNDSTIADTNVYIGFWGSTLNATLNGAAMAASTWYALSTIDSLTLDATTSGRIYVGYGIDPATTDPNSSVLTGNTDRFDKFELTFDGSSYGVADLTAIDFWSIPMSLSTQFQGQAVDQLDGVKSGASVSGIYAALSQLSQPVRSTPTAKGIIAAFAAQGTPLPTGIQTALTQPASGVVTNAQGGFVRVIGPNSYPPFGDPATNAYPGLPFTPYDTFAGYFGDLIGTFGPGTASPAPGFTTLGNGKIAHIKGQFAGNPQGSGTACEAQSYDLWASIDAQCNLTIAGKTSLIDPVSITISQWNLLDPASCYGANPSFSLNGGAQQTPQNDVYAWILGDFFAGLNIGAIGSAQTLDKVAVGDMASSEWFSRLPPQGLLFDKLWGAGVTNHWNTWAQALNPLSDAYNFAFAERFSAPLISLDPARVDTLTLTLLDARVTGS
ncbi:hypothetical protein [Paracidovorax anthurii]|uniref:GH64 domain-containing protein n=1 Tax=Paracidovorax anthurii TaxID=78229 RepID=A0A328YQ12_9BURK|nr:hypothetical protein [Paracidovorax anthurii]RAR76138.1 hypothetical protein AX018_105440 [Paracidovorax anthurii]